MLAQDLSRPLIVVHYVLMTALHEQASHDARRARVAAAARCVKERGGVPPTALPGCVRFTFDLETGAFRRKLPDVLAQSMNDSGLDVSWSDTRSGMFGIVRRFTIEGSVPLVEKLISELGVSIGWQPGPIALPALGAPATSAR